MDQWPRDPSSVPPAALTGAEIRGVLQQGAVWPLQITHIWKGFKREESKKENRAFMEQGHCVHPSPPGAAEEPLLLWGCGEPSPGPPVPLGSFRLPTEQTVIRKWGDQQQAQGCVCTEHGLPGRALTHICLLFVSSWDVLTGSSTNTSAGPLFEFRGDKWSICLRET